MVKHFAFPLFSFPFVGIMGDFEWWPLVEQVGLVGNYVSHLSPSFLNLLLGKEVNLRLESTLLKLSKLVRIKLSRLHPTCFHFWQPRGSVKGLGGLVSIRSPRLWSKLPCWCLAQVELPLLAPKVYLHPPWLLNILLLVLCLFLLLQLRQLPW